MKQTTMKVAVAAAADVSEMTNVDELLGLPAEASQDELLEEGVKCFNASGMWMARAGRCWQRLREQTALSPQEAGSQKARANVCTSFEDQLEARGIGRRHAYNAIKLAEYLGALPEAEARRMLKVPYTKVLALASADPEVVQELLDEGALDGDQPLSVRDLRARLDKAGSDRDRLARELEIAQLHAQSMQRQLDRRANADGPPEFVAVVRMEGAALTEAMAISLDELDAVLTTYITGTASPDPDHAVLAAGAVYHALGGIMARCVRTMESLRERYAIGVDGDSVIYALPDDELEALSRRRDDVLRRVQSERDNREWQRQAAKPRGRGRPAMTPAQKAAAKAAKGARK